MLVGAPPEQQRAVLAHPLPILAPVTWSPYVGRPAPVLEPTRVSSSGRPGPWITPSSVT